jgi:hypothetical protein
LNTTVDVDALKVPPFVQVPPTAWRIPAPAFNVEPEVMVTFLETVRFAAAVKVP